MKKGFALILLIFLLVACSLVATVSFSLLASGTTGSQGSLESIQAYAIAIAGKEWYLQQLADDSDFDWTNQADQTDIAFDAGSFDIDVEEDELSANSVPFTVTARVPGYLNQTAQRQIRLTARRFPRALRFAIFWQEDGPGARLLLDKRGRGTKISGDFWSVGSTRFDPACVISDGMVYYGAGETIDGRGKYTSYEVEQPFPDMPIIDDVSEYEDLMREYNQAIAANTSGDTEPRSVSIHLTAGAPVNVYDFITQDNLTITGNGRIVAANDVLLHNSGKSGTLTIAPSEGGTIEIIAGNNFKINQTKGKTKVVINPGTVLYARNQGQDEDLFEIVQANPTHSTSIAGTTILAGRRLEVSNGATISNSALYVDYADSDVNNLLTISDSGTTVSGAVISRGRGEPSLLIDDNASINGLVYQYGYPDSDPSAGEGRAQIGAGSSVTGALLVRQFYNDSLGPANITCELSDVLVAMPDGFGSYVMVEPDSWDDN